MTKKKPITLLLALMLVFNLAFASSAHAAYAVYDSRVYGQVAAQLKKATEQINQLKQQINLQLENLQTLSRNVIDPIKQEIAMVTEQYTSLKKGMSSIISGTKDVETAFKEAFKDFQNLGNLENVSYADLKGRAEANQAKGEELNKEFLTLINAKQEELKKSNERILKLTDQIANAKGAKDLAQLQNLLTAEQTYSQNITNEIQSLKLQQSAVKAQIDKLADDAAQKSQEKLAADFGKVANQARPDTTRVETVTGNFYRRVNAVGWE